MKVRFWHKADMLNALIRHEVLRQLLTRRGHAIHVHKRLHCGGARTHGSLVQELGSSVGFAHKEWDRVMFIIG